MKVSVIYSRELSNTDSLLHSNYAWIWQWTDQFTKSLETPYLSLLSI